jgi:sugar O-acyltransferase (sialic acid O-acetyltransferase NeuD family)|tara:strand:+ start:526 stop:1209 length:684 start_codon:yes stop_codon:yes gene_type:complete
MKKLLIFGTGEISTLAKYYFETDSDYNVEGFVCDDEFHNSDQYEGLKLHKFSELKKSLHINDYYIFIGISYRGLNKIRENIFLKIKKLGFKFASYISSKSQIASNVKIGENCFILENQTIQPFVEIGDNVILWSGNHIGHRSKIGNHVYISSHVCVAGYCEIGERTFIGVNSALGDYSKVGKDTFISMSSIVYGSIKDGSVIIGKKTQVFESDTKQNSLIKKKYFFN